MSQLHRETLPIVSERDVVLTRARVRDQAVRLGFKVVDQTKLVTAASELARNALVYGGGGTVTIESFGGEGVTKLQLTFVDEGPGIADLARALEDGYSTGRGLGLGLGGSKRLVQEFEVDTRPGFGTRVRIAQSA
jgi:serine/threonine-protein kinase RsbT